VREVSVQAKKNLETVAKKLCKELLKIVDFLLINT